MIAAFAAENDEFAGHLYSVGYPSARCEAISEPVDPEPGVHVAESRREPSIPLSVSHAAPLVCREVWTFLWRMLDSRCGVNATSLWRMLDFRD